MKHTALLKITLLITLCLVCTIDTSAQQTIQITEYGFSPDPEPLSLTVTAAGDSIMVNRGVNHQVSDSPDWPHAVEICAFTVLIRQGKMVRSSGSCIRTDDDGDQNMAVGWYDEEGVVHATYLPGTGKYAGMECTYALQSSVAGGITGFSTNHAELTCTRN